MKYDIFSDEVIVGLPDPHGNFYIIQLTKEKISSFSINNHLFVKTHYDVTKEITSQKSTNFYECPFKDKYVTLYVKHQKERETITIEDIVYSEFNLIKSRYLLYLNNKFYEIKGEKSLVSLFPNEAKYISKFYTDNREMLNSNPDNFITSLVSYLSSTLRKEEHN